MKITIYGWSIRLRRSLFTDRYEGAMAVTYLMLARLPEGGLGAFDAYESAVLPLLAEYGGRLERRLRTMDDQVEAHLLTFPGSEDLAAYRADPRRSAAAPLLESSGAAVELLAVRDV
ncbi:hypothetical protein [Streptomyces adonidis]